MRQRAALRDLHSGKSDRREWHTVGAWLHPGERIVIVREDEAARKAATVKQPLTVGWKCPISHPGCARNCGNYGCGN
ncbi:MAG: hypothetical protein ACK52I_12750 [Pseudomonadota bacterium]